MIEFGIEFGYGLLAVIGGLIAGGIFFGGLWWTVQRIPHTKRPALLVLGSLAVRLLLSMGVFYGVMAVTGNIVYLAVAVVVFIGVRMVMSNKIRPKATSREQLLAESDTPQERFHATES